jgi:CpeT protein
MTIKTKFISYFEGYFDNQKQAFYMPREFALIEVNHTKISTNKFKVTQKYVMDANPYRNSIIEVTQQDGKIILKSYKQDDETETYLSGCDVEFIYDEEKDEFHGKNTCKECFVEKGGKNTYLVTEAVLGNNYYNVIDKGHDPETDQQLWGSYHGLFQFDRK